MVSAEEVRELYGVVRDSGSDARPSITGALVSVYKREAENDVPVAQAYTDDSGRYRISFKHTGSEFKAVASAFNVSSSKFDVDIASDECQQADLDLNLGFHCVSQRGYSHVDLFQEGEPVGLEAVLSSKDASVVDAQYLWSVDGDALTEEKDKTPDKVTWHTAGRSGPYRVKVQLTGRPEVGPMALKPAPLRTWVAAETTITVIPRALGRGDTFPVTMRRTDAHMTADVPLWAHIRKGSAALSFGNFDRFLGLVLCGANKADGDPKNWKGQIVKDLAPIRCLPYNDMEAYKLLKVATEAFLMVNCGTVPLGAGRFDQSDLVDVAGCIDADPGNLRSFNKTWTDDYLKAFEGGEKDDLTLPYLALVRNKLKDLGLKARVFNDGDNGNGETGCYGILKDALTRPCLIELIWSYWHECGMFVQSLNAISLRFQNRTSRADLDPLANLEMDSLRPLNNLLWGYVRDEQHRLTLAQRVYEYAHQYGLTLEGKAVPRIRPADNRSKFLEAFHGLLHLCTKFFGRDDDTTVISDGFPVLNALRDVHLVLTEGQHNQHGDMPSTARQEMLMQQWLLARPEMREFLPSRISVVYKEPWMDRVDAMKRMQGWMDTTITHFHDLAVFGEQILLSIRFGAWSHVKDREQAKNWARYWRSEIQGYIYAYQAATGVDLSTPTVAGSVDVTLPTIHLQRRLKEQAAMAR